MLAPEQVAARTLRESYGKLLARLACDWKDLGAAEDALAEAFEKALTHWPRQGVPRAPSAWLLTVARRQLLQKHRKQSRLPTLGQLQLPADPLPDYPDDRLRLMLVCAHPALDPAVRTPLMLQVVLGLQASEIASALLISPDALAQRLVRAKRKLREAGVGWEEPGPETLAERLQAVLDAIYAAYSLSWETFPSTPTQVRDLDEEALYLADLVVRLRPAHPEARGLLALMLHCETRKLARRTEEGRFVPLAEQDVSLWNRESFSSAERHLSEAAVQARPGPYQLEAAIQSAHNQRIRGIPTPWSAIAGLYRKLNEDYSSWGSLVAEAIANIECSRLDEARDLLDLVPEPVARGYQPWWVARAYWEERSQHGQAALLCYQKAIGLSSQPAIRDYLQSRLLAVQGGLIYGEGPL